MGMGGLKRCIDEGGNVIGEDGVPGNNIGAARDHGGSKCCSICSRAMEVFKHSPGFPSALEADKGRINIGAQESHGSTSMKSLSTDIIGINT